MKFIAESKRMNFFNVEPDQLDKVEPIFNSNPFYNLVTTGKEQLTIEEIHEDWQANQAIGHSYPILLLEKSSKDVIGYSQFILCNPRDQQPWLGLLIIHQEKQGNGYASEFINELTRWYRENGYDELHLGVVEKNQVVLPFYQNLGFVSYETRETEQWGKTICMKKRINSLCQ